LKIKVEGAEYEFPAVDSLTMDETILLERVAGTGIETLVPGESLGMGAVKAFVMIAVMRARPETTEKELADAIGKIKLTEMQDLIQKDAEDDADPPSQEPGSGSSGSTSGAGLNGSSESSPAGSPLADSGLQVLRTGATSGQKTSAA
jgi:hypothetical protein